MRKNLSSEGRKHSIRTVTSELFLKKWRYYPKNGKIAFPCKNKFSGTRKLSLFALLPALCNMNEPILFGSPVVLNPLYLIPFILTAYLATVAGYLPFTILHKKSYWFRHNKICLDIFYRSVYCFVNFR